MQTEYGDTNEVSPQQPTLSTGTTYADVAWVLLAIVSMLGALFEFAKYAGSNSVLHPDENALLLGVLCLTNLVTVCPILYTLSQIHKTLVRAK